jgi:hypothetical protein
MVRSFSEVPWLVERCRKLHVDGAICLSLNFMQGFYRPHSAGPSSEAALVGARRDRESAPAWPAAMRGERRRAASS